jgi:YggT family protein
MNVMAGGPLSILVQLFFGFLLISVIASILLSWLPISPGNPISRFFTIVVYPIMEPLNRRIPPIGMLNINPLIALWLLWLVRSLLLYGLQAMSW